MADVLEPTVINRDNSNGFNPGADMLMRGHAVQQTRTSFCTAMSVQKPRELPLVERRFLEEARMAGEDFYYGWGAGKDRIEGPSKGLACAAARCWGNCAIEVLPVQDMPDSWVFTACFIDLETGFTMARQFRQSKKWTVYGKLDAERKDDIRFQIGQSKAIRNVVLNALPDWLLNKAMDEAKKGVKDKLDKFIKAKGLPAAQDMAISILAKYGVKEEAILAKFSVATKGALDIDKLVILRGDITAIENGQERAEELFPASDGASKTAELKEKLKAGNGAAPEKKAETKENIQDQAPDEAQLLREDKITEYKTRIEEAKVEKDCLAIGADLRRDGEAEILGPTALLMLKELLAAKRIELSGQQPAKAKTKPAAKPAERQAGDEPPEGAIAGRTEDIPW